MLCIAIGLLGWLRMLRLLVLVLQELERITNDATVSALSVGAPIFGVIVSVRKVILSPRHG